ncbi:MULTISPECIES: sensor histidine kinase [Flavobacterium]|uniref:histidine kinase n=1 Tax=Flavobacterium ranwuense TaxID=2541725 RepID=A0ABY2DTR1_9FLAO|nr:MULTISPECIES: HAMP domain-containing sensor histidine kinase [Flavobacterium]TDE30299.1 HAMP domain-containing histidine kinase [Flavobacterium ranwuense]TDE51016.1 HAMP domain-containing histidine kinase [Flavobacterium sp. GT3P67]
MKLNKLNSIIILGIIAIVGILVAQLLWTKEAFTIEEKKFSQKTHIALLEVAKKLYHGTNHDLPTENPIKKISNDYYVVNIDNDFEPEILEFYLKSEFKKMNLTTDFEYAMYNCQSDEMVYGNYISLSDKSKGKQSIYFPKHKNLVYYFAIRFPNETTYLFSSLRFWFVLSMVLILILLIYVYSIFTLLQQKKYSELQRDFINNMTHEFKTPLSSILIASNYLIQQKPIKEDKKLYTYAEIIINQSNKLNQHIEQILTIAKSDYSPIELNTENIAIVPIIENAIENIKLKYPEITTTIKSDSSDYTIIADSFHFNNLVYNLLDNAAKYCNAKPEIVIRLSKENQVLKLEFIDNGIGISNKNLSFIFDKFYRIPSEKSNEVNGFGLGLYYVKKICNLHQWKINATNNLEKGITLTILIPNKQ